MVEKLENIGKKESRQLEKDLAEIQKRRGTGRKIRGKGLIGEGLRVIFDYIIW